MPLLERVRFLAISATNLNEFYMVRVAGLNGQVEAGITARSQDGMTPAEQLAAIAVRSRALMDEPAALLGGAGGRDARARASSCSTRRTSTRRTGRVSKSTS